MKILKLLTGALAALALSTSAYADIGTNLIIEEDDPRVSYTGWWLQKENAAAADGEYVVGKASKVSPADPGTMYIDVADADPDQLYRVDIHTLLGETDFRSSDMVINVYHADGVYTGSISIVGNPFEQKGYTTGTFRGVTGIEISNATSDDKHVVIDYVELQAVADTFGKTCDYDWSSLAFIPNIPSTTVIDYVVEHGVIAELHDVIGDVNGDGIPDRVAGGSGGFRVQFMQADGSFTWGPSINSRVYNGMTSISRLGDLDGDGIADVMYGAHGARVNGKSSAGAIGIVLLNADGSAKLHQYVTEGQAGFNGPLKQTSANFGYDLTPYADTTGDGRINMIAVAAYGSQGIYFLDLRTDGTVKDEYFVKINNMYNRISTIESAPDLNNDGVPDLFVQDFLPSGQNASALVAVSVSADLSSARALHTIHSTSELYDTFQEYNLLMADDIAVLGDIDNDGYLEVAVSQRVGFPYGQTEFGGSINIFEWNPTTQRFSHETIFGHGTGGFPEVLEHGSQFGYNLGVFYDLVEGKVALSVSGKDRKMYTIFFKSP